MKKSLLIVAALVASPAAFAVDTYTCDGFKYDKAKDLREQIPDTKFEVQESKFSITILNKDNGKSWFANNEVEKRHFKNGNYDLVGSKNKNGKPFFGYFNKETNQTVIFTNCVPKEDF